MNWMKDDQLFADVEPDGGLCKRLVAAELLPGQAAACIRPVLPFNYCPRHADDKIEPDAQDCASGVLQLDCEALRDYLRTHDHIGAFPDPHQIRQRQRGFMKDCKVLVDADGHEIADTGDGDDSQPGIDPDTQEAMARHAAREAAIQHNRDLLMRKQQEIRSIAAELESQGIGASVATLRAEEKWQKAADEANAILMEHADEDGDWDYRPKEPRGPHYTMRPRFVAKSTESFAHDILDLFCHYWKKAAAITAPAKSADLETLRTGGRREAREAAERLDALLMQVNQKALLEYKLLRFMRLWILHSARPDQAACLEAVDAAQRRLEEKVQLAAAYTKAVGLPFRLEWVL